MRLVVDPSHNPLMVTDPSSSEVHNCQHMQMLLLANHFLVSSQSRPPSAPLAGLKTPFCCGSRAFLTAHDDCGYYLFAYGTTAIGMGGIFGTKKCNIPIRIRQHIGGMVLSNCKPLCELLGAIGRDGKVSHCLLCVNQKG